MRDSFITELKKQAEHNEKIILITADLGFKIFDEFKQDLPKQFLNVGVAEQNMTEVACGLALEGYKVFTYSIGNFSTLRCLEQIRNDVCYHDLDITVVSSGAGFSYGQLGISHFATEDLAIMSALPNMSVFVPADSWESTLITKYLIKTKGPKYLRIDKSEGGSDQKKELKFEDGFRKIFNGSKIIIISIGGILEEAIKTREILKKENYEISIISVFKIKDLNEKKLVSIIRNFDHIITLEEHTIVGGLFSKISQICINNKFMPKSIISFGIPDTFPKVVGSQSYLRTYYGIDSQALTHEILKL
tara:strand:- start:229 stop:1140 length:912 start_codon:yes stop_codon:yes gene_type:complete